MIITGILMLIKGILSLMFSFLPEVSSFDTSIVDAMDSISVYLMAVVVYVPLVKDMFVILLSGMFLEVLWSGVVLASWVIKLVRG